jgi:hypothetical protein
MKDGHHASHPDAYRALVNLVTYDHMTAGFCASVFRSEYHDICKQKVQGQSLKYWIGGEYSFCVGAIAQLANHWLDANNPGEKDMAYVFDSGNQREREADMFLRMVASDPLLIARKRMIRYYSHSFVDGKRRDGGALQAADMLAWNLAARGISHSRPRTPLATGILGVLQPSTRLRRCVVESLCAPLFQLPPAVSTGVTTTTGC